MCWSSVNVLYSISNDLVNIHNYKNIIYGYEHTATQLILIKSKIYAIPYNAA